MATAEQLAQQWRNQLQEDCAKQSSQQREAVVQWLIGEDKERFESMSPEQVAIARQAMQYRYRILLQRYLGISRDQAYRRLLQRLSSLFLIRSKIRTWVSLSRDRHRTVMDVLQEVIQELMQSDKHMQRQVAWIAQCTTEPRLRNALALASIEEYCLRPIRNQPLLVYRFVNFLRRTQRGGMTQVPTGELIRLVSDEVTPDDTDNPINLLDNQAITDYQEQQHWEEQQLLRNYVQSEFSSYLASEVEPLAADWLKLHLQGLSQDTIATQLDIPINKAYRLREKVSYHAIRVFGLKEQPELVATWLGTSLKEHSLGLTPEQWQQFWDELDPAQQRLIEYLKDGQSVETIAETVGLKTSQVLSEWSKLYLQAQALRTSG